MYNIQKCVLSIGEEKNPHLPQFFKKIPWKNCEAFKHKQHAGSVA